MRGQAMPGRLPAPTQEAGHVSETTTNGCSFRTQQGAYILPQPHQGLRSHHPRVAVLEGTRPLPRENLPVSPPFEHPDPTFVGRGLLTDFRRKVLLRKEVIQPHLPVRLPCYDFVPIASPTFDGSLPYGLGHRLRVLPTFVT